MYETSDFGCTCLGPRGVILCVAVSGEDVKKALAPLVESGEPVWFGSEGVTEVPKPSVLGVVAEGFLDDPARILAALESFAK